MVKLRVFSISLILAALYLPSELVAQNDFTLVRAREGEGIYALLIRNNLSPGIYFDTFVELNGASLGRNHSLIGGKNYKIPVPANAGRYPIFGKEYEMVERKDDQLEGAVFYLVSGHGGSDQGASIKKGNSMVCEDEYAYDITLRLARRLIEHGALVYMITRDNNDGIRPGEFLKPDSDETCYPDNPIPAKQTQRLRQRASAVNLLYRKNRFKTYQRAVIIHLDSQSRSSNIDVYFYHHPNSRSGKELATILQQTLKEKYRINQPNRGYTGTVGTRNLYMLKKTTPVSVFIELGNIRNYRDQLRFLRENNRQALANWLCEGLIKDYNSGR
ncbi:MAG: N-acetylmuramoyl-L-alanine amidase [Bacteroidales bacterium]|nr:MAG: N-acetylmuramoyl-L-alanine amidase [Bacteroidales bacterium]